MSGLSVAGEPVRITTMGGGATSTGDSAGLLSSLFGDSGSGMGLNGLLSLGSSILGGILGMQQNQIAQEALGLAKKQFGFQKGLANRNLANQSKMINTAYDAAANIASQLGGNVVGKTRAETSALANAYKANSAQQTHVDGSPIRA